MKCGVLNDGWNINMFPVAVEENEVLFKKKE